MREEEVVVMMTMLEEEENLAADSIKIYSYVIAVRERYARAIGETRPATSSFSIVITAGGLRRRNLYFAPVRGKNSSFLI